jgi:hypothetical protein
LPDANRFGLAMARSFQPQPSVALMGSSSDFYEERPGFERVSREIGLAVTAPQFCIGAQGKAQPDLGRLLSDLGFQRMNASQYGAFIPQNIGAVMAASKFAAAGPRNPLCTWPFYENLLQKFLIANATGLANSCGDGGASPAIATHGTMPQTARRTACRSNCSPRISQRRRLEQGSAMEFEQPKKVRALQAQVEAFMAEEICSNEEALLR